MDVSPLHNYHLVPSVYGELLESLAARQALDKNLALASFRRNRRHSLVMKEDVRIRLPGAGLSCSFRFQHGRSRSRTNQFLLNWRKEGSR